MSTIATEIRNDVVRGYHRRHGSTDRTGPGLAESELIVRLSDRDSATVVCDVAACRTCRAPACDCCC